LFCLGVEAPVDLKECISMRTYFESYFPLLLLMFTLPIGHLNTSTYSKWCTCTLKMKATDSSNMSTIRPHDVSKEDSTLCTLRVLEL
jgi:hypothetical protein